MPAKGWEKGDIEDVQELRAAVDDEPPGIDAVHGDDAPLRPRESSMIVLFLELELLMKEFRFLFVRPRNPGSHSAVMVLAPSPLRLLRLWFPVS